MNGWSAYAKFVTDSNSVNPLAYDCILFKSLYCMVYRSVDISCVLNSEKENTHTKIHVQLSVTNFESVTNFTLCNGWFLEFGYMDVVWVIGNTITDYDYPIPIRYVL